MGPVWPAHDTGGLVNGGFRVPGFPVWRCETSPVSLGLHGGWGPNQPFSFYAAPEPKRYLVGGLERTPEVGRATFMSAFEP